MERTLGRAIRTLRLHRSWTQPRLSQESGVPQNTIRRIESDQQRPTLENLIALARAFGITVDRLLIEAGLEHPWAAGLPASVDAELASLWLGLSIEDRETVLRVARGLAERAATAAVPSSHRS